MRGALSLILVLAGALTATSAQAEVSVRKVGDFERPVYVTGAPGDDDRLYVVEQRGTVQVVENGVARQFLDLRTAVRGPDDPGVGGEEGMLSMAFPPDFQTSRRVYVYFTEASGSSNRVEELRAPTGDTVDVGSRRRVISIPHAEGSHHNGGQIQFGPGGTLYIAPGDGGTGGGPARDLGSLLGKVLRIYPHGSAAGEYTVPFSNPFAGQRGRRGEVWASGLRNPFRFSFDRATGDLTIGDVGEKTTEEIDYLPAAGGGGRGANFGWNACEGSFMRGSATEPCGLPGSVLPAIEHAHADGYKSVIGGYVVRDPSLPSLHGRYVYGDFYVDRLRSARLEPAGASDDREVGPLAVVPRITSFGEDAAGCVYATSFIGGVYRLVEDDVRIPCALEAPPPPPQDSRPPALRAVAGEQQRVLRRRSVVAYVRCDETCRVSVGGRLVIGTRRGYALRRSTIRLPAGQRQRVAARLPQRVRRALSKALANGRAARALLDVTARDATGNPSRLVRKTVRIRR
jgi:hypothetical protein